MEIVIDFFSDFAFNNDLGGDEKQGIAQAENVL
jgi:hypothetical protein